MERYKIKMNELKEKFLNTEFWILSFGGAFQRANVYKSNVNELDKKNFRKSLVKLIERYVKEKYKTGNIDGDEHCRNIEEICKVISSKYEHILRKGRFRIGICQKLLNLYLKYLWCVGLIDEPPHCPIDRTILSKVLKGIKWPEIVDIAIYRKVINEIHKKAQNEKLSVAKWELKNFNRKNLAIDAPCIMDKFRICKRGLIN